MYAPKELNVDPLARAQEVDPIFGSVAMMMEGKGLGFRGTGAVIPTAGS